MRVLPVDRDDMASCVERLTRLQQKLESAGVWSATEREAVRDALEHSRGVYSKLIEQAPAHRDALQKVRAEILTDFSRLYESMYLILAKEPGFAEFNTQADRCASNAPQQMPSQPDGCDDATWAIVCECLAADAAKRPTAQACAERLRGGEGDAWLARG